LICVMRRDKPGTRHNTTLHTHGIIMDRTNPRGRADRDHSV
jgi:hypothetical protein